MTSEEILRQDARWHRLRAEAMRRAAAQQADSAGDDACEACALADEGDALADALELALAVCEAAVRVVGSEYPGPSAPGGADLVRAVRAWEAT